MIKTRIFLNDLRKYDDEHGSSLVREIEMYEDGIIQPPGYGVQFRSDVQLYGLEEAFLYLKGVVKGQEKQMIEFEKKIKEIISCVQKPKLGMQ